MPDNWKPRSGTVAILGVPWLARMTDKARASLEGRLGDYIFPCPQDQALLRRLRLSPAEFLSIVRRAESDGDIVSAVQGRKCIPHRSPTYTWPRPSARSTPTGTKPPAPKLFTLRARS